MASSKHRSMAPSVSIPALLSNGQDTDFRSFIHDLLALSVRVQEIFNRHAKRIKRLYDIDFSASQLTLLTAISRFQRKGPVYIKTLAEHLRVSPSFISMEVNNLVHSGMVEKSQSPGDLRVQVLELTARGWEVLDLSSAEKVLVNDIWFQGIDGQRFEQYQSVISELLLGADNAIMRLKQFELEDFTAAR